MNGTESKIDTPVARGSSRHVHFQLISLDGHRLGIYDSAREAASAAGGFWPGVGQKDDGRDGWDIEAIR